MYPFRYTVSFRVFHPRVDPEEITAALHLKPGRAWKVGEQRKTPEGDPTPTPGVYKETYWTCVMEPPKEMGLCDFLSGLVKQFDVHRKFLRRLVRTGGRIEFFVGWFQSLNSGEEFDWELLGKLADLRIDLALDVYAEEPRKLASRNKKKLRKVKAEGMLG